MNTFFDFFNLTLAIVGTAIAVWQAAVIRERKTRDASLQFLLVSIRNLALLKQQAWSHYYHFLTQNEVKNLELLASIMRAHAEFGEVAGVAAALEKAIDVNASATNRSIHETLDVARLNKQLQDIQNTDAPGVQSGDQPNTTKET